MSVDAFPSWGFAGNHIDFSLQIFMWWAVRKHLKKRKGNLKKKKGTLSFVIV